MKYLALILFSFLSCNNMEGQESLKATVKFEYAGEDSDKPIRSTFITTDRTVAENPNRVNVIYVSNNTYNFVERFVKSRETVIAKDLTLSERDQLGLLVSIHANEKDKKYLLLTRKDAVNFLSDLEEKY